MRKGPKAWRVKKRKERWIIIFEGPGEDEGGKDVTVNVLKNGGTGDEQRAQVYSSALQARKALVFNAMAADALWLLNLENGDTQEP